MAVKKLNKEELEKVRQGKIVDFVRQLFTEDPAISTEDCINSVCPVFPNSKFQKSHVAYYRNRFRKQGMEIPFIREPKDDESAEDTKANKPAAGKPSKPAADSGASAKANKPKPKK